MKKAFLGISLFCLCLLCGCGTKELENNAFPLAIGIGMEKQNDFSVYMAYPDLLSQEAKDNALSTDAIWSGTAADLFAAADEMSENSNKNVDFNHLKVLILDRAVLEQEVLRERLVSFFLEQKDAAWNTYVMLADGDMDELFSGELEIGSSLGISLEDTIEEWTNIKSRGRTTVGNLMSQYYNGNETALVPVVSVREQQPHITGFAVLDHMRCVSVLNQEEAYETLLLKNKLKAFSYPVDDVRVTLQLISVKREIRQEERPIEQIQIHAVAQFQNRVSFPDRELLKESAERKLKSRLSELLRRQQEKGIELTDSFLLLPGYNRALWEQYRGNREEYEKQLDYKIEVHLSVK